MYLMLPGCPTDIAYSWARPSILAAGKGRVGIFLFLLLLHFYCPPPFRRKVEGHCFWFSVVRGAWCLVRGAEFLVGTLSP